MAASAPGPGTSEGREERTRGPGPLPAQPPSLPAARAPSRSRGPPRSRPRPPPRPAPPLLARGVRPAPAEPQGPAPGAAALPPCAALVPLRATAQSASRGRFGSGGDAGRAQPREGQAPQRRRHPAPRYRWTRDPARTRLLLAPWPLALARQGPAGASGEPWRSGEPEWSPGLRRPGEPAEPSEQTTGNY